MKVENSTNEEIYTMNDKDAEVLTSSGICNPRGNNCGFTIRAGCKPSIIHPVDSEIHKDNTLTQPKAQNNPSQLHKNESLVNQLFKC